MSALCILFGIPFGVTLQRGWLKAYFAWQLILLGLLATLSIMYPAETVRAFNSVSFAEIVIGIFQSAFGIGVGWVASVAYDKIKETLNSRRRQTLIVENSEF